MYTLLYGALKVVDKKWRRYQRSTLVLPLTIIILDVYIFTSPTRSISHIHGNCIICIVCWLHLKHMHSTLSYHL